MPRTYKYIVVVLKQLATVHRIQLLGNYKLMDEYIRSFTSVKFNVNDSNKLRKQLKKREVLTIPIDETRELLIQEFRLLKGKPLQP